MSRRRSGGVFSSLPSWCRDSWHPRSSWRPPAAWQRWEGRRWFAGDRFVAVPVQNRGTSLKPGSRGCTGLEAGIRGLQRMRGRDQWIIKDERPGSVNYKGWEAGTVNYKGWEAGIRGLQRMRGRDQWIIKDERPGSVNYKGWEAEISLL